MNVRPMLALAAAAIAAGAAGQTKWKHEKLLSESPTPGIIGGGAFINASGVAAFLSGSSVYKGSTRYGTAADGWVGGINDSGQIAWRGHGHVFVEHTDVSAGIVVDGDNHSVQVFGVSNAGVPFWTVQWTPPVKRDFEMYLGSTSMNVGSFLGANRSFEVSDRKIVSRSGLPAWSGSGDAVNHLAHVYRGTEDVSGPVLGAKGGGSAITINDLGQVAWLGSVDPKANKPYHAYVDGRDISGPVIGAAGFGYPRSINNRGQVLWEGSTPTFQNHAFLDSVDYTARVFGTNPAYAYTRMVTESGHILWLGGLNGQRSNAYVDDRDATGPIAGYYGLDWADQIDEEGRLAWAGYDQRYLDWENVWVDDFNLSADALGSREHNCMLVAMGPSGHVLWMAKDENTGLYDFWLSTPVPEPAPVVSLVVGTAFLAGARRR